MKRKSLILILVLLMLGLCACTSEPVEPAVSTAPPATQPVTTQPQPTEEPQPKEGNLIGEAQSEEEARKIAQLYGIEFVDFNGGLALFNTEEDPSEVIQRGAQKEWPLLELNGTLEIF